MTSPGRSIATIGSIGLIASVAIGLIASVAWGLSCSAPLEYEWQRFGFPDGTRDLGVFGEVSGFAGAGVHGGALRFTANAVPGETSAFKLPDLTPGQRVRSFTAQFDLRMQSNEVEPSNGITLTFGEIPDGVGLPTRGFADAPGMSIRLDIIDRSEDPMSVDLIVSGRTIASTLVPFPIKAGKSRPVVVRWGEQGLDLRYGDLVVFENQSTKSFRPKAGYRFAFSASTGPAPVEISIDNLKIDAEPFVPFEEGVRLSEVLPVPYVGISDEDFEMPSWIEIFNGTDEAVNLKGWSLLARKPNEENGTSWTLPDFHIPSLEYGIVFASGKNRWERSGILHTNFQLSAAGGRLVLSNPNGVALSVFSYDETSPGVSYGRVSGSSAPGFMRKSTPGRDNVGPRFDHAEAPSLKMSHAGGIVRGSVTLAIECVGEVPEGGAIRYSIGSSKPTAKSPIYDKPLRIKSTLTVRAAVFAPGHRRGPIARRAFVMLNKDVQQFHSNLPVMVVDSAGVDIDADYSPFTKRKYRDVYTAIFEPNSVDGRARLADCPTPVGFGAMRVRGHSSALNFPKKQYVWELRDDRDADRDVALLGMPANSDWVLAAPYCDKTLMRNVLAFESARDLFGKGGGSRTRFVELFFNQDGYDVDMSDYLGVYVLTEKIKRGPYRIDIMGLNEFMVDPERVTGGYIFKFDKGLDWDERIRIEKSGQEVAIVEPDASNGVQKEYLSNLLNHLDRTLHSGHFTDPKIGYATIIDPDSFVDLDLMVEVFKECDGWWRSSYFTKDRGGKIRAMPVWDYNLSLGNGPMVFAYQSTGWIRDAIAIKRHPWFSRLREDSAFTSRFWTRYLDLRKTVLSTDTLFARIESHATLLEEAAERNYQRWPILGENVWPFVPGYEKRKTFRAEVDWMKDWLRARLDWIDAQHVSHPTIQGGDGEVTMSLADDAKAQIYYTTDGSDPAPRPKLRLLVDGAKTSGQVLIPTQENGGASLEPKDWTNPSLLANADKWTRMAKASVGYEMSSANYSRLIHHHVPEMFGSATSCYIRIPFQVEEPDALWAARDLQLFVRCDDGFVAYLNGERIASKNAPLRLTWDSRATMTNADELAVEWVAHDVTPFRRRFRKGQNVIAIHGLNERPSSTDALWSIVLNVLEGGALGPTPQARLYNGPIKVSGPMRIRAATFTGKLWSMAVSFEIE